MARHYCDVFVTYGTTALWDVVMYYREEANEFIEIGALNGLFVLGRSIGFVGRLLTSYLVC